MKLFVGNLSPRFTESDLRAAFSVYGEVASAHVVFDPESGRSRGYGFVEMPDSAAAGKAADALRDVELDGCRLTVTEKT